MMKPKMLRFFFALLLPGLTISSLADDALPRAQSFSRYGAILKHSPFAVATATAPVSATADFAKDLYIANVAHTMEADYVTLASTTDKNLKEYLNTKEPVDGYSVSNIEWSDQVGQMKVTISKNGQFATLTFNEALLSQAIQNAMPQVPMPPQPTRPQPNLPLPRPGIGQPIPTPPPHVRSPIRRKSTPSTPNNAPRPNYSRPPAPAPEDEPEPGE